MRLTARIVPIGLGLYGVSWEGEIKAFFHTVTAAGLFCIENYIPFEPWGVE